MKRLHRRDQLLWAYQEHNYLAGLMSGADPDVYGCPAFWAEIEQHRRMADKAYALLEKHFPLKDQHSGGAEPVENLLHPVRR